MIYFFGALAVLIIGLFYRNSQLNRAEEERDALQKLKEYQLAIITEAAKKKAKIDQEAEAEKAKLPDMTNAELEKKVNE